MAYPNAVDEPMGDLVRLPLPTPSPAPEPVTGDLVDADGDGFPDTRHTYTPGRPRDVERVEPRRVAVFVAVVVRQLPARLQDPDEAKRLGGELARHATMAPLRYPTAVLRGSAVVCRAWWQWVTVKDYYDASKQANQLATKFDDIQGYRVRRRWWTLGTAGTTGLGLLVTEWVTHMPVFWIAAGVASVGLAIAGRRKDGAGRSAVLRPRSIAWTMGGDNIVDAFRAAKLIDKKDGLAFVERPHQDGGGWAFVVDLPPSRKASAAVANREALAAALAVDEVQLIVERVRGKGGHAGRVSVWVANEDPYATEPQISPLGDVEDWDLWRPVPFGLTARGGRILLPLVWTSLLVGAIPRMGKTFCARIPTTAGALDPHVRLIVFDGKPGKDWRVFEMVAHRFGRGDNPTTNTRLMLTLAEAVIDAEQRFETLGDLDDDICPDGKVTPEITRDPKYNMPLTVISIDEVQVYLEDETPVEVGIDNKGKPRFRKRGAIIADLLTYLVKKSPAVGYVLVLATQKPDGDTIPPKLRDNVGTRFALKTMTWQASEVILGTGTHKAGIDASTLLRTHKGVGLLVGSDGETELAAGEAVTVRTDMLTLKAIRAACERGRQARIEAGTLTGDAAGNHGIDDTALAMVLGVVEQEAAHAETNQPALTEKAAGAIDAEVVGEVPEMPEVLALLLDVIEAHETGIVSTAELAERIGEGWEAKALGEALRAERVPRPEPDRQRVPGGKPYPVPVQNLDAIKSAIAEYAG